MSNLFNLAAEIYEKGFNPDTDPVSSFEKLPDGIYECIIEKFELKIAGTGTEYFNFTFKVITGDYINQKCFGALYLSSKTANTSLKRLIKYGRLFDIRFNLEDFKDADNVVEKMQEAIGETCVVKISTTKNDFQNFDVEV